MPKKVFISYAQNDPDFCVDGLAEALNRNGFVSVWDRSFLQPGNSLQTEVKEKIAKADMVVSVLTPYSVGRPWLARELYETVLQECLTGRRKLFPVLLGDPDLERIARINPAFELWTLRSPLFLIEKSPDYKHIVDALNSYREEKALGRNFVFFQMFKDGLNIYRTDANNGFEKNEYFKLERTVDSYFLYGYPASRYWKYFLVCDEKDRETMKDYLDSCENIHASGIGSKDSLSGKWRIWFLDLRRGLSGPPEDPYTNNML